MDRRKPSPLPITSISAPTDKLCDFPGYSYHPRGVGNESVFHFFLLLLVSLVDTGREAKAKRFSAYIFT